MARGPRKWTEELIRQRIAEGYGQGSGPQYKAWINTTDVSSIGLQSRVWSQRFQRRILVLSEGEKWTFYVLESASDVEEIREQFPLDRDLTQEIAMQLGIPHPCYPGTNVPCVMTVDFLVTKAAPAGRYLIPLSNKVADGIEDEGQVNKHEIVRRYFDGMQARLQFVVKEDLPKQKIINLSWIRGGCLDDGESEPYPGYFADYKERMTRELTRALPDLTLSEYCAGFASRCSLPLGDGLRIARMLIYDGLLSMDLGLAAPEKLPMACFRCTPAATSITSPHGANRAS